MAETATFQNTVRDLPGIPLGMAVASSRRQMTMIKWRDGQRAVLVQTMPAVANLGLGALVFGQFLRDQPFSVWLAVAGTGIWLGFVGFAVVLAGGETVTNVLIMFGGILFFCGIITLVDWLARRKERQSEDRPAA